MATHRDTPRLHRPPGDSYVQSFARGLQVIRSFSASAPRQTLSEVAAASGLTRAGARRILLTLQTLGYVESDGKLFALTPRILDLGFAYLSSMPIWNRAEPVMEALVQQVQESCSAAVLDATDIVYVMRVPTHKIMSISLGVGSRLPAYCTSMGRLLLADLRGRGNRRARLAASTREALTKHTVTDVDALLRQGACRRGDRAGAWSTRNWKKGWSRSPRRSSIAPAAPVAALNISGQANRTSAKVMQETMLPALLASASTISRLL